MPIATFTVFQDQNASSSATSATSKRDHAHGAPFVATKENINPLTGLIFDSQPPTKKRKPSSSSALKAKRLSSSSKPSSTLRKLSSTNIGKDKGGRRKALLGLNGNRIAADYMDSDAEQSRTALGNRNAYDLTVMPLADVTQAYDATEAARAMTPREKCLVGNDEHNTMGMEVYALSEESDVQMHNMASKETKTSLQTTEA